MQPFFYHKDLNSLIAIAFDGNRIYACFAAITEIKLSDINKDKSLLFTETLICTAQEFNCVLASGGRVFDTI